MPGLAKIGYTDRSPIERAGELSRNTGIPTNFEVHAWWQIEGDESRAIEQRIHQHLHEHRYNKDREFFSLSAIIAQAKIELLLENWRPSKAGSKYTLHDVQQQILDERRKLAVERNRRENEERLSESNRRAQIIDTWNKVASLQALETARLISEKKIGRMKANNYSRMAAFSVLTLGVGALLLPTAIGNINKRSAQFQRQVLDDYRRARTLYFKSKGFADVPWGAKDHSKV